MSSIYHVFGRKFCYLNSCQSVTGLYDCNLQYFINQQTSDALDRQDFKLTFCLFMNIKRLDLMTYLHRSIPAASVKLFLKYKVLYMNEYNDDNLKLCTLNYLSVTASPEGLRQDQERSLQ